MAGKQGKAGGGKQVGKQAKCAVLEPRVIPPATVGGKPVYVEWEDELRRKGIKRG